MNRLIKEAGFEEQLEADHEPKIVVGYVKHASRILTLTIYRLLRQKWTMGQYCKLFAVHQISKLDKSCRCKTRSHDARWNDDLARNFARVASYGMICSARELHLPNAPEKGILVLPEDAVVGEVFQNKEVVTSLCHNLFY